MFIKESRTSKDCPEVSDDEENDEKLEEDEVVVDTFRSVHHRHVDQEQGCVDEDQTQDARDMANEPH